MKKFLLQIIATGLAFAAVLAAYEIFFRRPQLEQAAAAARAQAEALQGQVADLNERLDEQTAAVRQEVRQTGRQTGKALRQQANALDRRAAEFQETIAAEKREAEALRERYLSAALVAEGLQVGMGAKVAVTEYYANRGEFPTSNEEAELDAPGEYQTEALVSMRVGDGGVVTLAYAEKVDGAPATIQLVPEVDARGGLRWRCETASYRDILRFAPQCKYVGAR